jgi:hypothetical protein
MLRRTFFFCPVLVGCSLAQALPKSRSVLGGLANATRQYRAAFLSFITPRSQAKYSNICVFDTHGTVINFPARPHSHFISAPIHGPFCTNNTAEGMLVSAVSVGFRSPPFSTLFISRSHRGRPVHTQGIGSAMPMKRHPKSF